MHKLISSVVVISLLLVAVSPAGGQSIQTDGDIETDAQLVSNVATGTPPLVVSSTTLVANLSADTLRGIEPQEFAFAFELANLQTQTDSIPIGDQEQPLGPFVSNLGTTSTPSDHWQSFRAPWSGTLSRIRVNFFTGESNVTLQIFSGQGIGGTMLHSQAATLSAGETDIILSSPVEVQMNQDYTFRIFAGSDIRLRHSNTDAYPLGVSSLCCGYDFEFKTFIDKPLILRAPNGGCWALVVDNAGALGTVAASCP